MNHGYSLLSTTSIGPSPVQIETAQELANLLQIPYVSRGDSSLSALCSAHGVSGALVVSAGRVSCIAGGREFFFHPGLAMLRIKELKNGKIDKMIEAMALRERYKVLDCTLGLGSDAIVASFVAGESGRVVGLEGSPVIAAIVARGLAGYRTGDGEIDLAMRRIEVIAADHQRFLEGLAPGSFDVIYFDPMFRQPRKHSPAINAMRCLAKADPLKREAVETAVRIAAKRVVVKERRGSSEFDRLGIEEIYGGRYAPVVYGVIRGRGGVVR
ncbi:MAG: class I SAM-dependent methyltransferase [Firmicutes bacterium]|nr:class I SAM-dependent methyltransferase [Bacillota bacterium]